MGLKLLVSALTKYLLGIILVGALLFIPAGTLHWWQGWLFISALFVPILIAGVVMFIKAPDLLRKRLNTKETESEQRAVVGLSALVFIGSFVAAGLSYRFGWLVLPDWVSWCAAIALIASYALYAEVMRENAFLSRVIEVQESQTVIDTGLYGVVRHPMYSATLLLFLSIPLVLGSVLSFVIMLAYVPLIIKRIRNEEAVLAADLNGYANYINRVKWRLIPHIW